MNTRSRPIDPHEAQHDAREFDMLQGLVVVAAGVGMTLYGLLFSSNSSIGVIALLAAIGIGAPLAASWYAKHYGRTPSGWKRNLLGLAIAIPAVVLIFAALGVDHLVQLPLLLSLLATAALLWVGIRLGARRLGMRPLDHAVLMALAALSLTPLFGGPHGDFPAVSFYFTVTGLALILLGIGWHRRLVAVMGKPDDA